MPDTYRVLIVDDDPSQVEWVSEYLRISGAYLVSFARNLQEFWERLSTEEYDIILLDYRLPDGTGLNALEELSRRGKQVPVVFVTGQGDERVAVQAMQLGASDYLIKGESYLLTLPALIQKTVRAHLMQRSAEQSIEQVRYQALLLSNVRDAVVVWNSNGEITYWNPAAEALFGWKTTERVGCFVEECYTHAFTPQVITPPPGGTTGQEVERQYKRSDQKTVWVSSRVMILYDDGPGRRLIGYMDVCRDITGRKKVEVDLRRAEARYRTLVEQVPATIYIVAMNESSSMLYVSPQIQSMLGFSQSEWLSDPKLKIRQIHPDDLERVQAEHAQSLALQGSSFLSEYRLLTRDGQVRWIHDQCLPVRDESGQLLFGQGIMVDITEHKNLEDQVQAAQKRMAQASRLAAIGELASGISHYINNPLAAIIAQSQLLLHKLPAGDEGRESAEVIEQAGWQAQEAIQRLLEFSRPAPDSFCSLPVNRTIENAMKLVGDHIQASGITLQTDLAEDLPQVWGNARQLEELWINLLLLARDAASDRLPHTICIRSKAGSQAIVIVEVCDDGKLIPADEIDHVFEPDFFKPVGDRGTGIEFSICHEIVRHLRGKIFVESNVEHGTIFSVFLGGNA